VITLTKKLIEACESLEHAYTSETLRQLGAMGPSDVFAPSGWKERITGTEISDTAYGEALNARSLDYFRHREAKKQLALF
jgi:hypothetical protein